MQATINATLVKTLTAQPLAADQDVRDNKLRGFVLRCRRSGIHTYRAQVGRGQWVTIGTTDKLTTQQARDEATRVLSAVALGANPVEERRAKRQAHDLAGFLNDVYEPWATVHLTTGTETIARLRASFAELLETKLSALSAWHLERWRTNRRKAGVRPSTINRDLNDLRALLGRAVQWKHLKGNPLDDVKPERVDRRANVRYLSRDEEGRLLTALAARDERLRDGRASANVWRDARGYEPLPTLETYADHLTPLVLLAMHTGLRRGELFSLEWPDINLAAARLTVRGQTAKSGQTRHLPLNGAAIGVLTAWGPRPAGYVFPSPNDSSRPLADVKTAWLELLKRASIAGFRFHDLRHTFASNLVQAGVDLAVVRDLLGHSTILMTEKYAHLSPNQAVDAVARLVRSWLVDCIS
ncbi:Tyrosine recombinase XerD [Luteitalea pratensis]|uniref:Tyrosine recombinase XerD n=1 Tax=Luteitalea pratensis TaxID=1855912 RepID=A0A143PNM5_LUTPR|nr:tyrosine-type recombinase/integrase [Luteitalea pratensis]AMY10016.1 Tyrosine recombinase XerD [Luteitalea pratensis]